MLNNSYPELSLILETKKPFFNIFNKQYSTNNLSNYEIKTINKKTSKMLSIPAKNKNHLKPKFLTWMRFTKD